MEYELLIPVAGFIYLTVQADNPEEAKEKAFTEDYNIIDILRDGDGTVDVYSKICTGNVLHVPYNEVEVV